MLVIKYSVRLILLTMMISQISEGSTMNFQSNIDYVLTECRLKNDPYVIRQLANTAKVESGVRNIRQIGGGPALGYFQIEPSTRRDIVKNYLVYRGILRDKIENVIGEVVMTDQEFLNNVPAQIVFAYLVYERYQAWEVMDFEMAIAWKTYYNTRLGAGTIKKYMETINGR